MALRSSGPAPNPLMCDAERYNRDRLGLRGVLPPVCQFGGSALAVIAHLYLPIWQLLPTPYRYIGIIPIAKGIVLCLWAIGLFRTRRTTVLPFARSSVLVTSGPFRFTRNPIYLGVVLMVLGFALLLGSLGALAGPLGCFALFNYVHIPAEEKVMLVVFGDEYTAYKRRVRRWL
jgi:protein-S-isoprenylcysteine O-methyltransferase Ste14